MARLAKQLELEFPSIRKQSIADRRKRALSAYINEEMTLQQIADRWGVTRECIRLDCNAQNAEAYKAERTRRKRATARRKAWQRKALLEKRECPVCGDKFETTKDSRQRFCCKTHNKVWTYLRYHADEKKHNDQRVAIIKWQDENNVGSEIWKENFWNGTINSTGRWLVQGSLAFHWAIRAYILKWPLFDMLPEQIQTQIREFVELVPVERYQHGS